MNDIRQPSPATGGASPAPLPTRNRGRRGCFFLVGLLLVVALCFALYVWGALGFSYADGERAGYVQKFSRKGWICKTWEGELAMVSLPGTMPELFRFTVRDAAVAEQVNQNMGKRVSLQYEQHLGIPTTCFGETDYFVVGVRTVD